MILEYVPQSEFTAALALTDPFKRAQRFADLCRLNALYMIQRAGSGHIGTSFSCIDILSYLFTVEFPRRVAVGEPEPIFFSSKGHDAPALYAVLTGLGRLDFDLIHQFRRFGGLPGHPDVGTPGIVTNTGSLGMGISKAKGIALANRLSGRRVPIYVLTGDGELQEGQIWESLAGASRANLHEITVIVDRNWIQSDGRVWDEGEIADRFEDFDWQALHTAGHSFPDIERAIADADRRPDPTCVIATTVKGRGYPTFEAGNWSGVRYRYHSGAVDQQTYQSAVEHIRNRIALQAGDSVLTTLVTVPDRETPTGERLIDAYSKALVEAGRANDKIVVLSADLEYDCGIHEFHQEFPDRYFECGIAEQDMVSMAGGLALKGYLPIVHSFAAFLTQRAAEQIANNASEGTKIIYVGSLAGILPAGPGHSHQSIRDIALMSSVPGMRVDEPTDEEGIRTALACLIFDGNGPGYLRLTSVPVTIPELPQGTGRDVAILAFGLPALAESVKAAVLLQKQGIHAGAESGLYWALAYPDVIEPNELPPLTVIVEHHQKVGGWGECVRSRLAEAGYTGQFLHLAVDGQPACGRNEEVLKHHGLDAESIAAKIMARIGVGKVLV